MSRYRLEVVLSGELLARLDEARRFEPRASFARRALEAALVERDAETPARAVQVSESPAPPRAHDGSLPEVPLPKIAKRKW